MQYISHEQLYIQQQSGYVMTKGDNLAILQQQSGYAMTKGDNLAM